VKVGEIPRQGTWLSSQRSQPDPHCPRCGTQLETSRMNGRTSYWCPSCQPAPRGGVGYGVAQSSLGVLGLR
jgi:formamidopyrimidine-DNA glycosylase